MSSIQARTAVEIGLGAKAPDAELTDQAGKAVFLSSHWEEQPLVLVLLNDLKPVPSVDHVLTLRDAHETFEEAGGAIAVVVRNDAAEIATFREKHNVPYPVLSDSSGIANKPYGVSVAAPGSFVIDTGGVVRYVHRASSPLDTPPTWELVDAVCGLTGAAVERPKLPNIIPTPISSRGEPAAPSALVSGGLASAADQASYACGKCGNSGYEIVQIATSGGWISRIFNFQYRKFMAVVCTACNYAELYRTKGGPIANIADILAGG